ncbi:prophage endopeptidase tail family protein [Paenibacillus endoradicis]|uniref:prophage endopeptidase tail family protein n=1 Tax=Paenibacillus endoradicis TaxID=2972487 RepID=UPI002158ED81|nr:prophage endopeptidase tail family protein [Paenibacillus endoradicis]MCR8656925.1 phage tail protein [Paenibacillus endoradicis]
MKRLAVYDRNMSHLGGLGQATDVLRSRRINSDYELTFVVPMSSEDYKVIELKGHVKDERGQYYVINDRSRKRDGVKRLVEFNCTHIMFKLAEFKFPYSSYIDEAYGVSINTLLLSISSATGGNFTFSVDDSFDLKDIKDFGRGDCLQALNKVVEIYECEIEPDNFNIHIKKQIGMNRGYEARIKKNIININFKDSSRALVTRMYSQMKDGRTFIGMSASNLTTTEYALLNAIPGAIVNGVIRVNYLISPYAAYWSNTTNTYFDGEVINQDIEDPLELLKFTRKSLLENEVPVIDITLNVADLHRIDYQEPEVFLGDTIKIHDPEMQIMGITARAMELKEPLFSPDKQPDFTLANYYLSDYDDILADLNKSKQIIDNIISGGKVRTEAFETFAAQAVHDINNSKTEVIYDERGIILKSKLVTNDQVVLSSKGLYITRDGGQTAEAALTAAGLVAEKVIGKLGNFIEIEIGVLNNVFKANQNGIHLGHQQFASSPFRVNMAGQLTASQANITGTIHATGGTFSGGIVATGTITGGTIYGAKISTGTAYPLAEMSATEKLFRVMLSATNFAEFNSDYSLSSQRVASLRFVKDSDQLTIGYGAASSGQMGIYSNKTLILGGLAGVYAVRMDVGDWSLLFNNSNGRTLQQELNALTSSIGSLITAINGKADSGASTGLAGPYNAGIPIGTQLMKGDGTTVTWNGIPAHSHTQN